MARPLFTVGLLSLLVGGCTTRPALPWDDDQLRQLTSPSLQKFESREALDDYFQRISAVAEANYASSLRTLTLDSSQFLAQLDPVQLEPQCNPDIEDCAQRQDLVVTGTRVSSTSSITNNQEANVDEGDIVKTFDRFLIVLQDGRLFSIDTGAAASSLTLVDRIDVYRDPEVESWYDELLINDNVIVVTGYNYGDDASELTIFEINENGIFDHKVTYYIGSEDYFSLENYASRLVDGNLVLYTPMYVPTSFGDDLNFEFPNIRHWTAESGYSAWQPLFGAEDVYRPILYSMEPVIHTVTVCPISLDQDWNCNSTGFVGPGERELYVTADYAYLWNSTATYDWFWWPEVEVCSESDPSLVVEPAPAALYRVPLTGAQEGASAVLTAGVPDDQFSMDAREVEFLALLNWESAYCYWDSDTTPMRYLRFETSTFGTDARAVPSHSYHAVPMPTGSGIENRFSEDYLVYSGSQGRWRVYWLDDYEFTSTELIVVPVHSPESLRTIPLAHSAERLELFGDNVVISGHQFNTGLSISTLDLRDNEPHLADQTYLDRVVESEGRSHAFNYLVGADGSGTMGFPTLFKEPGERRFWDLPSDVHFLQVDSELRIRPSGYLDAYNDAENPGYSCEVSCYDWYGNARPIFFRDRVFALSGVELIEGQFIGGQIAEIDRVNMTATPLNPR